MNAVEAEVLARVRRYRQAARMAVEADAPVKVRCLALLDLADAVRDESDLLVRRWAEIAIWEESKTFLGVDDEQQHLVPETYEGAQRRLRAQGYSACPNCRAVLATDVDLERWSRMRRDEISRLEVRERAVPS